MAVRMLLTMEVHKSDQGRQPFDDGVCCQQYDEFGAAYFKISGLAHISSETYRQIAPAVTEDTIQIEGEAVAISEVNAVKIRAHIRPLRNALPLER